MKCFRHPIDDAVALCTACAKGICRECAVDLTRGTACKGDCEIEVRRLIDLRDFSFAQPAQLRSILARSRSTMVRSSLYSGAIGAAFLYWGWTSGSDLLTVMGGIGVAYATVQLISLFIRSRSVTLEQFRLCPQCGYNVSGNTTGRCTECGARL